MRPKWFTRERYCLERLPDFVSEILIKGSPSPDVFCDYVERFISIVDKMLIKYFYGMRWNISEEEAVNFLFTSLEDRTIEFYKNWKNAMRLLICVSKFLKRHFDGFRIGSEFAIAKVGTIPDSELAILNNILLDTASHFCMEWNLYRRYALGRKMYLVTGNSQPHSLEILHAACNFLNRSFPNAGSLGNLVAPACSVFLIRQFIETRLTRALGICSVQRKDNYKQCFYSRSTLINFVEEQVKQGHMKTCFNIDYLKKIHTWCNDFIHEGTLYRPWEIELALEILKNENKRDVFSNTISIDGAFWIDKTYYTQSLETDFLIFFERFKRSPQSYEIVKYQKPESLIS